MIGTIWTASNGVNAFMEAANTAFNLEETRSFIVMRLLSIALTIALIFALLVTLVLSVFGNLIIENIDTTGSILKQVLLYCLMCSGGRC
ncbi:YhjD/YihY/BrkB family envelope integrity protein [Sinobaca sp. H24]|uniref:YhjD/YihY/BrkB family envelope integrity protein n=1 Tax=Sinobaca sp. H24 TaxID=2923376 RepID=UPI0027E27F3C|nr:YhjD/YihY/BrkB family envelope integrity protein [Sinobaca sp. H24]